jgi:hypothetical protein
MLDNYAAAKTAQTVISVYLIPIVAGIGLVCNVLSIAVLSRDDTMNAETSLLLRMLAAADFLNILFSLLWSILILVALQHGRSFCH